MNITSGRFSHPNPIDTPGKKKIAVGESNPISPGGSLWRDEALRNK